MLRVVIPERVVGRTPPRRIQLAMHLFQTLSNVVYDTGDRGGRLQGAGVRWKAVTIHCGIVRLPVFVAARPPVAVFARSPAHTVEPDVLGKLIH
jgi:hypothetical protein